MVSKELIQRYKDNIQRYKDKAHNALEDFEYAVDNCSKETPRTVARVLDALEDAVNNNALYIEEEKGYKTLISDRIIQFEKKCGCNK